jgi:hypothetical protein
MKKLLASNGANWPLAIVALVNPLGGVAMAGLA